MDTSDYPGIATAPKQSFFLFGPRAVGKSTGARVVLPEAHRFDFLDEGLYQSLLTELLEGDVPGLNPAIRAITLRALRYTDVAHRPERPLKDRMRFKGYRSGHVMYLRPEDLEAANEDIRRFARDSTPAQGQPAKYPPDASRDRETRELVSSSHSVAPARD